MKRLIAILSFAILLPLSVNAQGNFRDEYEKFKKQAVTTYSNFREQCNREYVEFLKAAWEYYQVGPVIQQPVEEEVPPVVIEQDRDQVPIKDNELPFDEVVPIPEVEPQPEPVEPVHPVPVIQETWCEFDFFGTPMRVH